MRDKNQPADPFESAMFAAELGDAPSIDLHGQSAHLALATMDTFLHQEMMRSTPAVRIIHGRGNGILRSAIRQQLTDLKRRDVIAAFRDTTNPAHAGAVVIVALHFIPRYGN